MQYGLLDMKEFSNDFWYSITSGALDPGLDGTAVGQAFIALTEANFQQCFPLAVEIRGVAVEINAGGISVGTDVYQSYNGAGISDYMPEDVAVVIRKLTTHPGKPGRGRWYFCGAGQADVKGSYLTATGITHWEGLAVKLKTAITVTAVGGTVTLSPAHFSPNTGVLYPLTNTPVVGLLGTRRRRRGPF